MIDWNEILVSRLKSFIIIKHIRNATDKKDGPQNNLMIQNLNDGWNSTVRKLASDNTREKENKKQVPSLKPVNSSALQAQ